MNPWKYLKIVGTALVLFGLQATAWSQEPGPDRKPGEGPFSTLIVRGVTLIDGTGAPPRGPVDIFIADDHIVTIQPSRGVPVARRSKAKVLDATGMYAMPGFVNLHAHTGRDKAPRTEYVYKLWLAHGITTVRGVSLGPEEWTLRERERSAKNEIVAPRMYAYHYPPAHLATPEAAREWVKAPRLAASTASSSARSDRASWRRSSRKRIGSGSGPLRTSHRPGSRR